MVILYQKNWYSIPIKYHLSKYQKNGIQDTSFFGILITSLMGINVTILWYSKYHFLVQSVPFFWYSQYHFFGIVSTIFWYKPSTIILVHWYFLYQESGMTIPQKAKTWYCQYHYCGSKNTTKAGIETLQLQAHTRIQNRVGRESYY